MVCVTLHNIVLRYLFAIFFLFALEYGICSPIYTATELDIWSGAAINSSGEVAGFNYPYVNVSHTVIWNSSGVADLGVGGVQSEAQGINDLGAVVGSSGFGQQEHAALWQSGNLVDLGTLGGPFSIAQDINNIGQIVGAAENTGLPHAFLYTNGTMQDLGTLGGDYSFANSVNDSGDVVGWSWEADTGGAHHPFLYSGGVMVDLGSGVGTGSANGINNAGEIVGDLQGEATLWYNGTATSLGLLGGTTSGASAINNYGEIVGSAQTASGNRAFVYVDGVMYDLNSLITGVSGVMFDSASAVNDSGQIVVDAVRESDGQSLGAFLLTPTSATPEPATGLTLTGSMAVFFLAGFIRRQRG